MIVNGYIQSNFDWKSIVDPKLVGGKFVKVYLLAKEGISRPKLLGLTSKPLEWTREAVESLASQVKTGIQAFFGHGKTNEHTGRTPVGELVGSTLKEIGGKLHHYVAVASDKPNNYDVISMEASIEFEDHKDKGIVSRALELTGLALGIKGKDIPGVEGAEMVAQMQFFEPDKSSEDNNRKDRTMTLEEVKRLVKENGWGVTAIFPTNQVIGKIKVENGQITYDGEGTDPAISKVIGKYVLDQINPVLSDQKTKIEEYEPKVKEYVQLKTETEKTKAKNQVDQIVKDRSLTESHKKYLDSIIDEYDPNSHKFDEFVESKLGVYKKLVDSGLILTGEGGEKPPKPGEDKESNGDWEKELEEIENGK